MYTHMKKKLNKPLAYVSKRAKPGRFDRITLVSLSFSLKASCKSHPSKSQSLIIYIEKTGTLKPLQSPLLAINFTPNSFSLLKFEGRAKSNRE